MNNKILLLVLLFVEKSISDTIPVAVSSRRDFGIETIQTEEDNRPYRSHTFEIEPSSAPLRLIFSSESSPLELEVEKVFNNGKPDVKTDRSGAINPNPNPLPVQKISPINDEEYTIIDSYERYVPVKIRTIQSSNDQFVESSSGNSASGTNDRVVVVEPPNNQNKAKVVKIGNQSTKPSKKIIDAKTTVKPVKQVMTTTTTTTTASTVTEEQVVTNDNKDDKKFGARITRHTTSSKSLNKKKKSTKKSEKQKN